MLLNNKQREDEMKQVKPAVGQVWRRVRTDTNVTSVIKGADVVIQSVVEDAIVFRRHSALPCRRFLEEFYFIPQNDLEWLAVNLDKWYCAADYLRNGSGTPFICNADHSDAIKREQWQNMRYQLGLDTKPHYKLNNGQWSETK